ncbi:hypothetical protein [uncultured Limosilactobacillus sp.]|uniref:hypothetical protein n=1 Tax=uncultured Limosilactobacillus sp. TaxID=2837629 RepID=UPI0025D8AADE|nr:hypothetical protein [uncultured Limosilactobacillus sp.]
MKITPRLVKTFHSAWFKYARPSGIKRTRKRQIHKAKLMDHGSYEFSQYWRKSYGKFRRNATIYSKKAGK